MKKNTRFVIFCDVVVFLLQHFCRFLKKNSSSTETDHFVFEPLKIFWAVLSLGASLYSWVVDVQMGRTDGRTAGMEELE